MDAIHWVDRGDGVRLAAAVTPGGAGPAILFLPGYMSDMEGSKALHLAAWGAATGRRVLRFDYSGCGRSEGEFRDGSISRWTADARAVADALAPGPLLLVGSSMGGWIMLHLALMLGARVTGLVGIAAAPDFTRWGLDLTAAERAALAREGEIRRPSPYGAEPYRYTAGLIADGEARALLDAPIALACPVRLLHGTADAAVPVAVAERLMAALTSPDVELTLVKGGDHRLSSPRDLARLERTVAALC